MENSIYDKPYGDSIDRFSSQPGIMRDLPTFASESFIDGQHVRFDNGFPRKMGGYIQLITGNFDVIRQVFVVTIANFLRVFVFQDKRISQFDLTRNGIVSNIIDRTPIDWEPPLTGENYIFSVDLLPIEQEGTVPKNYLIFTPLNTCKNIYNNQLSPIFIGDVQSTAPFEPVLNGTSGGIVVLNNIACIYGSSGNLFYSTPTNPFGFTENQIIANEKLIACRTYRDGLLFWTASKLIYAVFVGGEIGWQINVVASNISILSPSSIVGGHNNTFYWVGISQFYSFNGAVDVLPNPFNKNTFFQKINYDFAGNCWGMFVENFSEIWWFAPQDDGSEATHLYFYDTLGKEWSDTKMGRSCGFPSGYFLYPILASSTPDESDGGTYPLWYHEKGYDKVINNISYPIPSYFTTRIFSLIEKSPSTNVGIRIRKVEKNFQQIGKIKVDVYEIAYPDSQPQLSDSQTFTPEKTQIDLNAAGRFVYLKFTSNDLNGFYQMGHNLIDYKPDTTRPTSKY